MSLITIRHKGNFSATKNFLEGIIHRKNIRSILEKYGQMGVDALSQATPVDTGLTAASWYYEIKMTRLSGTVTWCNSNIHKGVNIALILDFGHATRNGGYVRGYHYISPTIQPIFTEMANAAWDEVTK